MTVKNAESANYNGSIAIDNTLNSPVIQNVTVTAFGKDNAIGVKNLSSSTTMNNMTVTINCSGHHLCYAVDNYYSSTVMKNMDISATGGMETSAVRNYGTPSPTLIDITATADEGTQNLAIHNHLSSPVLFNVIATATGGIESNGIGNDIFVPGNIGSYPTMTSVIATASGATVGNYGMKSNNNTSSTCRRCTLQGETGAVYATGDSINRVIQSSLIGGVIIEDNGIITCVNSDNGSDKELDINCSEMTP